MAKRSGMSDDEFGAKLCRAYDQYEEHRAAGRLGDGAPGAHEIVNQLISANRGARDEAGLGPVEIEKRGSSSEEGASDDVQPKVSGGLGKAQDSFSIGTDSVPRYFKANGQILEGDAAIEANARRQQPTNTAALMKIPGYGRL